MWQSYCIFAVIRIFQHPFCMIEIINLSQTPSLISTFMSEVRQVGVQQDSLRFRRNMERIGELIAYEISKRLDYVSQEVTTPLGTTSVDCLAKWPILGTILRAGLPFHQGFLNVFDHSQSAFISAYREECLHHTPRVHVEYIATPSLENQTLLLVDPMLATGLSMELAFQAMVKHGGCPQAVHFAAVIASKQAVDHLTNYFSTQDISATLWVAAIDPELNDQAYIVPGLGDAGDLAYGSKL